MTSAGSYHRSKGARRVVLHIGLPKAASSTLQSWAWSNREQLAERGVFYPAPPQTHMKKHQVLVRGLFRNDHGWLREQVAGHEKGVLFLSTEGLSKHLQDVLPDSLADFRDCFTGCHVELIMIDRELEAWLRSFYRQNLLAERNERFAHGMELTFEEYRMLERVQNMCDRNALLSWAKSAYGAAAVYRTQLEADWPADVCDVLGVSELAEGLRTYPAANVGFPAELSELVRQVNGMNLSRHQRQRVFSLMQHLAHSSLTDITADVPSREDCQGRPGLLKALSRMSPQTPSQASFVERLHAHAGLEKEGPET